MDDCLWVGCVRRYELCKTLEEKSSERAGEVAGKTARGEYGLIAKAKLFASKLAKFINTVSMALNKMFATGLPLMGVIRRKQTTYAM